MTFQVGEHCYALVPSSSGPELIACEVTGPLTLRDICDLDGNYLGQAMAHMVLLENATRECPFGERHLRKRVLQ